jgi:hypothetical protein
MKDKIFDIDGNVWNHAINVIKLIYYPLFQGQHNSMVHAECYHHSLINGSCTRIKITIASECH